MTKLPGVLVRALLLVVAVVLPSALPGGWPARPDLVLVVVAASALMQGPVTGMLVGLAGGWLVDLVPPGAAPLGGSALTYAAAGALVGVARRYAAWSALLPLLAVGAGGAVVLGVRAVTSAAGVGRALPGDLLWTWLLTLVIALVLLPLLLRTERWLQERRWA